MQVSASNRCQGNAFKHYNHKRILKQRSITSKLISYGKLCEKYLRFDGYLMTCERWGNMDLAVDTTPRLSSHGKGQLVCFCIFQICMLYVPQFLLLKDFM